MFPLNWNIPFIRKNGSRTTLGAITGDIAGIEEDVSELTEKTDGLWDNMMDNGAVNILNNTLASQTANGVIFTVNADKTIATTGTPSTGFSATIGKIKPPIGKYKLTCSPSSSTGSTYKTQIVKNTGGSGNTWEETGDGFILNQTNASDEWTINIRFSPEYAGTQLPSGLVWKPMLSDPSLNLSYDDYVPYAMTNRELTENVTPISDVLTMGTDVGAGGANYATKVGRLVTFCFVGHTESERAKNSVLATLPYLPKDGMQIIAFNVSTNSAINLSIGTDGKLKNSNHIIANDNYFVVNGAYVTS